MSALDFISKRDRPQRGPTFAELKADVVRAREARFVKGLEERCPRCEAPTIESVSSVRVGNVTTTTHRYFCEACGFGLDAEFEVAGG